jgi:hypothetical protein
MRRSSQQQGSECLNPEVPASRSNTTGGWPTIILQAVDSLVVWDLVDHQSGLARIWAARLSLNLVSVRIALSS